MPPQWKNHYLFLSFIIHKESNFLVYKRREFLELMLARTQESSRCKFLPQPLRKFLFDTILCSSL